MKIKRPGKFRELPEASARAVVRERSAGVVTGSHASGGHSSCKGKSWRTVICYSYSKKTP